MKNLEKFWKQSILFLVFLLSGNAEAQVLTQKESTVNIKGTVVGNTDNGSLPGSTVTVKGTDGSVVGKTITANDGSFSIKVKNLSTISISIAYLGFKDYYADKIKIENSDLYLGRISIEEKSTAIQGVTITASRKKPLIENGKDRIIYNAASDISNKSGNAADVLRKAPMLTVGAGGDLKLRGNSNIKVLINGVPSRIMAKNLKEALKMIPASSIVSVEVMTNPSAKYEAEGAAGVVNIITRKKLKGTSGVLDLTGGNLEHTGNIALNASSGKFDFTAMGNYSEEREKTASLLERINLENGKQTGSLQQQSDLLQTSKGGSANLSARYKIDSLQTLEASFSYWKGSWPQSGGLLNRYHGAGGSQEYRQNILQTGKFNYTEWMLNYQKKFKREGQELQIVGQASTSSDLSDYTTEQYKTDGTFVFREQGPNRGKEKEWSFQADYTHPLSESGKTVLETGVKYLQNHSRSAYELINSYLPLDPSRSGNMAYRQSIFSAYATLNFDLGNDWTFRPGLRFEGTDISATFQNAAPLSRKFSNWVPNVLLSKKVGERNEFKLDYNERIRRPWIMDLNPYSNAVDPLNVTQGNPYLKPELTRKLELSHTYTGSKGSLLTSSLYYSSNKNAVEQITKVNDKGIAFTTPDNIGESTRMGLNVNTVFNPVKSWTVNAGAELFHLKFRSSSLGISNNGTFFSTSLSNTVSLPNRFSFSASADYGNGFITLQGKNSANYSYRFAVKKEFLDNKASLTLTVINPFQNNFRENVYAYAPTFQSTQINRYFNRAATLTFSWSFGGLKASRDKESSFSDNGEDKHFRKRKR
ncbi:TonB-dependent receptor [uncultured Chryseobacterium sp.]|uniref:TonB-dependent receptor domain-containing protein n=1 Tax=uncultured Chryseobacterium sp. TaxID=259322 RepID=UPI0025D3D3A8|nr:TonB-dependent receptor [uncultured Chryseobacterium sp.]